MEVSLKSLKLTLGLLLTGIEQFDFEQASRVRGQIHALKLLLSDADKGGAFAGALDAAYTLINARVSALCGTVD